MQTSQSFSSSLPKTYTYKSLPSEELKLDLYLTSKTSKGCLVFLHGGALLLGTRTDLPEQVISFLNLAEWDVASIDYRLTPTNSISEILEDVQDACIYLRAIYPNLPLLTFGYSAGAYLAHLNGALGAKVDGICAFAGYGDLKAPWYYSPSQFFLEYKNVDYVAEKIKNKETFLSTNDRIDLYVYLRQKGLWPEFVLGKESLSEKAAKFSPINFFKTDYPATVLIHGDQDCDVPFEASIAMSEALNSKLVQNKLIVLPNLDHDLFEQIDNPAVAKAWTAALDFLAD